MEESLHSVYAIRCAMHLVDQDVESDSFHQHGSPLVLQPHLLPLPFLDNQDDCTVQALK